MLSSIPPRQPSCSDQQHNAVNPVSCLAIAAWILGGLAPNTLAVQHSMDQHRRMMIQWHAPPSQRTMCPWTTAELHCRVRHLHMPAVHCRNPLLLFTQTHTSFPNHLCRMSSANMVSQIIMCLPHCAGSTGSAAAGAAGSGGAGAGTGSAGRRPSFTAAA